MGGPAAQGGEPFRMLVLPVFRRYWLYYGSASIPGEAVASSGGAAAAAAAVSGKGGTAAVDWRQGRGIEERAQLALRQAQDAVGRKLLAQWRELQAAQEGSIKNRMYRLAQWVLAREEPEESFLKAVPASLSSLTVVYPESLGETRVRRRLRMMVRDRQAKHRRRMVGWAIGFVPLLPLMATPLPNIPVYYAGYRLYSNYKAMSGAQQLAAALKQSDAQQLGALRDALQEESRVRGVRYDEESWPARLLRREKRYLDILEDIESRARAYYSGRCPTEMAPTFVASRALDKLTRPMERADHPLPDTAVAAIDKEFRLGPPNLLELVARARRRLTGASFPREYDGEGGDDVSDAEDDVIVGASKGRGQAAVARRGGAAEEKRPLVTQQQQQQRSGSGGSGGGGGGGDGGSRPKAA